MANRIPRKTQVIKAIPKIDMNQKGVMWCIKEYEHWSGLDESGKWWHVFTSHLRNENVYDIECFESWDDARIAGAI